MSQTKDDRQHSVPKARPIVRSAKNYTHTHKIVLLFFWNLSGTTRVSRYQKGKNQEGKNQSGFTGARDSDWQWHLLGHMQRLLPSTSCKVSLCRRHMVHLIPHSTHPQSSSLHGAVNAGSLSEIEKRALSKLKSLNVTERH